MVRVACNLMICSPMRYGIFFFIVATIFLNLLVHKTHCATVNKLSRAQHSLKRFIAAGLLVPVISLNPAVTSVSHAAQQVDVSPSDLNRLKMGLREITYLIDNWDEKTTYCNFGEFQRELLLPENKAKLMDAAKEASLWDYDKSKTMNVMCKRDPQVVRAFLGLTPDNLLLNRAEVLMKKSSTIDRVDPDMIDEYFEAVETYVQAIATADSLAYQARSDFASTETVSKDFGKQAINTGKDDYLSQSKRAVVIVRDQLKKVVSALAL